MIKREKLLNRIKKRFNTHRILCLIGPKGAGKTTLAREYGKTCQQVTYMSLKNIYTVKALDDAAFIFEGLRGLIIIDEIQRKPEFFSYLKYLHDKKYNQYFLILGEASKELLRQSSESLAGRISYIEVLPFSLEEVKDLPKLWTKGAFPSSYLPSKADSWDWREEYILSQLEYSLSTFGLTYDRELMKDLFYSLSTFHGRHISYSHFAKMFNVSQPTIKKYISYLESIFMVRLLKPWMEDLTQKQAKSPKFYFRDSGLLNYIFDIKTYDDVRDHGREPLLFRGFAIEEIIKFHDVDRYDCFCWSSKNSSRVDLILIDYEDDVRGFIFTLEKPKLKHSMRNAKKKLKLDYLTIIYPEGNEREVLAEGIETMSLEEYLINNS